MCKTAVKMFRVVCVRYTSAGDDTFSYFSECKIHYIEVPVTKTTPKGHWVDFHGTRKFILSTARKKWAYPTRHEAIESFIAKKKRQIGILDAQSREAKSLLDMALKMREREGKQLEPGRVLDSISTPLGLQ